MPRTDRHVKKAINGGSVTPAWQEIWRQLSLANHMNDRCRKWVGNCSPETAQPVRPSRYVRDAMRTVDQRYRNFFSIEFSMYRCGVESSSAVNVDSNPIAFAGLLQIHGQLVICLTQRRMANVSSCRTRQHIGGRSWRPWAAIRASIYALEMEAGLWQNRMRWSLL